MADKFEGYCLDDLTYCIEPQANVFFPVRVVKVGRKFLDVVPFHEQLASTIAPEFHAEKMNRRFLRPKLPQGSRFGGFDERIVNADRVSGKELRILPVHYWTHTGDAIIQRNASDPDTWPIPTGVAYDRWFKQALKET